MNPYPRLRQRLVRLAPFAAAALATSALLASPVSAAPPGNNGTVKIHDGGGEPDPVRKNEPKVCTFHIHAFGFDPGQELVFHIEGQGGPNAGPDTYDNTLTVGDEGEGRDPASPDTIELAEGMYKLTTDTGDGEGTRDKHKVFKVECDDDGTPGDDDDDDDDDGQPGEDDDDDGQPGDDDDDDGQPGDDDDDDGTPPDTSTLPFTPSPDSGLLFGGLLAALGLILFSVLRFGRARVR
ncbi:hypothetical protein BH24CHL8_BH24CHL8_04140 [soil metagenome]